MKPNKPALPVTATPAISRRRFLQSAAAGSLASASLDSSLLAEAGAGGFPGKLCFFSKALPKQDWSGLGRACKELGFDGVDLTVRKGGHVAPDRAAEDLPKAVAAIREAGLDVPMITTALTSADDPAARPILTTAAQLGIRFFKAGYYYYKYENVRAERDRAGADFKSLAGLAAETGMQAGFHNHTDYIGAALWDAAAFIEPLDSRWAGYYFDPRHASAEGGGGAWKSALHLALARLKMVAIKDCVWQKTPKGWRDGNCPLGEGIVDWKYFFSALGRSGFAGPISLHIEYEIAGAEPGVHEKETLAATKRDLEFLKSGLRAAYCGSGRSSLAGRLRP
jgi:sugar phosphate isomerase/epimerase